MKYYFSRWAVPVMLACFAVGPVRAQVKLTASQWKAVEGVFHNLGNADMYVRFTSTRDSLHATLLWNHADIPFTPEADSQFLGKNEGGEPFRLHFVRDSTGRFTRVVLGNGGPAWVREDNYKPVVKTEMPHTPEQLKPFEGLYHSSKHRDQFIQFTVRGDSLVFKDQLAGGELSFVPQSELVFFSREAPLFQLDFIKEADGSITQARTFRRDSWIKAERTAPTPAELASYEGKYRMKEDSDNVVQLIAKGSDLIVRQLWDGKETLVTAITPRYFYNDARSYPVQVLLDKGGKPVGLRILGMDEFERIGQ